MVTRNVFSAVVAVVILVAAGACDDGGRRESDDHNGREEHPETPVPDDGVKLTAEDMEQLADATTRFVVDGVTLAYGEPGVMLTDDGEAIVLRDLGEKGHYARLAVKVRGIELDGKEVGKDAVLIGEENGTQWWRAVKGDKSRVYFVVSKY